MKRFKRLTQVKHKKIILLACCMVLLVSISFALFYNISDLSLEVDAGEAGLMSSWTFISTVEDGFTEPGDIVYGSLTLQNNGTTPIYYELRFELFDNTGLENATLIYVDDVLLGNLGYLCRTGNNGENIYKLPSYTLGINDTYSHKITLEYHIGASGYYFDKEFSLQVECYGEQILNTDGITYVNSWNELKQVANAQLGGKNSGEVIKLADNIASSGSNDLMFTLPATLDLNGKTLTLNKNIVFMADGANYLINTRPLTGGMSGTGRAVINSSGGLLYIDAGLVASAVVTDFSREMLEQALLDNIGNELKYGIKSNTEVLGGFALYNSYFSISLDGNPITDGVVAVSRENATVVKQLVVTVDSRSAITIDFHIIGEDDESILTSILNGPLSYISDLNDLNYDIFLPTKLKEYNCGISWWSSNSNVLDNIGVYTRPYNNTPVTLIANITFNGRTYTQEFFLIAQGNTNQDKLIYLCAQYGDILFSTLHQTVYLPTADNYKTFTNGTDFGITDITYSFDSVYSFLSIYNNSDLSINAFTTVTYLPLTITATFSGGSPSVVEYTIDVMISLAGSDDVEPIFTGVKNYLPKDIITAGFELLTEYNSFTINYYIPNDIVGDNLPQDMLSISTEVINSTDAYNIVSIATDSNGTQIMLDYSKIPPRTTLVYIIVEVVSERNDGEGEPIITSVRRQMSFVVGGVLHGDNVNKFNQSCEIQDRDLFTALKTLILTSLSSAERTSRTYIKLEEIADKAYSSLTLNNASIQSLQGLQYFTKLTYLNLSGSASYYNTFSDLTPLSTLTGLTYINLNYSAVVDISPLRYCTATPVGGITLNLQYNPNFRDNTPLQDLYIGTAYFTGTSCTYQLGAYTIFKWMNKVHGTISSTYNSYYSTSDVTNLIQTGSGKELAAFPLAESYNLPEKFYDTLIMPTSLYAPGSRSYSWSVISGMGSQYISISNPTGATVVSVNSRPQNDTTIVLILDIAAANNLSQFGIPRAFFITLKGTG